MHPPPLSLQPARSGCSPWARQPQPACPAHPLTGLPARADAVKTYMGSRHASILAWVQYTNLFMTGAHPRAGAAGVAHSSARRARHLAHGPAAAPNRHRHLQHGFPPHPTPTSPDAGIAYNITAASSMQAVACPSGNDTCGTPYWVFAVAFGGVQLFISQLPSLDSLWQISALGTVMSFGCEPRRWLQGGRAEGRVAAAQGVAPRSMFKATQRRAAAHPACLQTRSSQSASPPTT